MDLKLRIKKRTQPEWLVWLLVFAPFMLGTLFDFLPIPSLVKYVIDVAWVMLVFIAALNIYYQRIKIYSQLKTLSLFILAFLLYTLIIYIFNFQSPFYYLMGVRNNFRFYFAFISFVIFLEEDDISNYLKWYDALFWVNAVVMLFQYFVLGYKQDYLGGLFGTQSGCNGYVNIFFVIICAKSIVYYLGKKENIWYMLLKCGTAMLLATFSELKFFFIEFVVLIMVAVIFSGNSVRKILVVIGGILAVVLFINLLYILFPYFSELNNLAMLIEHQSEGYSGAGTIGRLNSIKIISDTFFDTPFKKLTGLGLGNCDTSTVDFLNTPFYKEHGYLRYFWFSTAHVTLETGYIGFAFFAGFFALIFVLMVIALKKGTVDKNLCRLTLVVSVGAILIVIYNSSLRTEAAYMIYFILSLPFAAMKNKRSGDTLNE